MVAGQTALCNLSYDVLGEDGIDNIDGTDTKSVLTKRNYINLVDNTLYQFDWPFALYREILAESNATNRSPYDYMLKLPGDCLRPVSLLDPDYWHEVEEYPWFREDQFIYTDYSPTGLLYVRKKYEPGTWDQGFTEAIITLLAGLLANKIGGNKKLAAELALQGEELVLQAAGRAGLTGENRHTLPTDWTKVV